MKQILRYWRDLSRQEKQSLMTERNIKSITFDQIEEIYLENKK